MRKLATLSFVAMGFLLGGVAARADCTISMDCTQCGGVYNVIGCVPPSGCIENFCYDGDCNFCGICDYTCVGGRPWTRIFVCYGGGCALSPAASLVIQGPSWGSSRTCLAPSAAELPFLRPASFHPASDPRVATQGTEVELKIPPDVPLRITNVQFESSPTGIKRFRYTLVNIGTRPLIAVSIRWDSYSAQGATGLAFIDRSDMLLVGGLGPGASDESPPSTITSAGGGGVARLVATLAYAEFAGGTRVGTDAEQTFRSLTESRTALIMEYGNLLGVYRSRGTEALLRALAAASTSKSRSGRSAAVNLLRIFSDKGIEAVVAELERVAALKVPK